jgi:hypothetical protein
MSRANMKNRVNSDDDESEDDYPEKKINVFENRGMKS